MISSQVSFLLFETILCVKEGFGAVRIRHPFAKLELSASSTAPVILSEQSESKDLGSVISDAAKLVRRFFDSASFHSE